MDFWFQIGICFSIGYLLAILQIGQEKIDNRFISIKGFAVLHMYGFIIGAISVLTFYLIYIIRELEQASLQEQYLHAIGMGVLTLGAANFSIFNIVDDTGKKYGIGPALLTEPLTNYFALEIWKKLDDIAGTVSDRILTKFVSITDDQFINLVIRCLPTKRGLEREAFREDIIAALDKHDRGEVLQLTHSEYGLVVLERVLKKDLSSITNNNHNPSDDSGDDE